MGPRGRAGLVLVLVFSLGVLVGIGVERHLRHPVSLWATTSAPSVQEEHEATMAELREVLELDEEQVAGIHAILAEHQEVVQRMWEQLRPEVQREMRQVHVEIAELLRPEQRGRFHDWLMERLERSEGRHRATPDER